MSWNQLRKRHPESKRTCLLWFVLYRAFAFIRGIHDVNCLDAGLCISSTHRKNLSGWIGGLIFHRSIWVCWKGKGKMSKPLRILAAVNTTFARNFLLFFFFLKHKGRRNGNQFFTLLLLRFLTFTEKERKEGELIGWIFTIVSIPNYRSLTRFWPPLTRFIVLH